MPHDPPRRAEFEALVRDILITAPEFLDEQEDSFAALTAFVEREEGEVAVVEKWWWMENLRIIRAPNGYETGDRVRVVKEGT